VITWVNTQCLTSLTQIHIITHHTLKPRTNDRAVTSMTGKVMNKRRSVLTIYGLCNSLSGRVRDTNKEMGALMRWHRGRLFVDTPIAQIVVWTVETFVSHARDVNRPTAVTVHSLMSRINIRRGSRRDSE
jgi:hypothetical protein